MSNSKISFCSKNNIKYNEQTALVLFSGGQDSTACLYWALENFKKVYTIGFHYGQRHAIEMKIRNEVIDYIKSLPMGKKLSDDKIIDLSMLKGLSHSSLVSDNKDKSDQLSVNNSQKPDCDENEIPDTFVPGRNLIFLTIAGAYAYEKKITNLCAGMSEVDYSGYPDCRLESLEPLITAINKGMGYQLDLKLPLLKLGKGDIWQLLENLTSKDLTKDMIKKTHTCYLGIRDKENFWGFGCGECQACELRIKGCKEYLDG